jgi:REP element-mobilizing transposase RayT
MARKTNSGWGGRRPGAGRPKTKGVTPRTKRPPLASRHPAHISLTTKGSVPRLRQPDLREAIEDCLRETKQLRRDFRVVHYSIQDYHLHYIVEAQGRLALSRGMQSLNIRVAKRINKVLGRRGKVFADRYFETIIKSPRQGRNTLQYVLLNTQKHAAQAGMRCEEGWIDDCSSGRYFDGWRGRSPPQPDPDSTVSDPRTYILSKGWRRFGLIPVDAVPGQAVAPRGAAG